MDKRQIFIKLEEKYEELRSEYKPLREDAMAFEGDENYDAYHSFTEDEVKKEMYPEQYEMYTKLAELEPKLDAFEKELENAAKEFLKQLNEEIKSFENKIEVNKKHIEQIEQEIKAKNEEIAALKETDAYKNGDEETLLKVEDLELEVKAKTLRKEQLEQRIPNYEKELEDIKKEKEELIEDYPEIEDVEVDVQKDREHEEQQEEEQTGVSSEGSTDDANKGKKEDEKAKNEGKSNVRGSGVIIPSGVIPNSNTGDQPKADENKEEKQEEKDSKQEFKELCKKAKKGSLTDKEFETLVDIMKNKENYEKLGITTGIVVNKSRGIFKLLNKYAGENEEKVNSVKEAYKSYEELFFEKHGEKKLNVLNKFFQIDEIESKNQTPALPETSEKAKSAEAIPGLEALNKTEEEKDKSYGDPSKTAVVKEEKDHDSV